MIWSLPPSRRASPATLPGRQPPQLPRGPTKRLPPLRSCWLAGGREPGLSFEHSPSASRGRSGPAASLRGVKCWLLHFELQWLTSGFLLAASSRPLRPSMAAQGSCSLQGREWKCRAQRTACISPRDDKGGMCPCCWWWTLRAAASAFHSPKQKHPFRWSNPYTNRWCYWRSGEFPVNYV